MPVMEPLTERFAKDYFTGIFLQAARPILQ